MKSERKSHSHHEPPGYQEKHFFFVVEMAFNEGHQISNHSPEQRRSHNHVNRMSHYKKDALSLLGVHSTKDQRKNKKTDYIINSNCHECCVSHGTFGIEVFDNQKDDGRR